MSTFPSYYDPQRIGTLFYPDLGAIAAEAGAAGLPAAAEDGQTVHLVIVDMQVDFCHTHGSLNVPGALDDIRRLIEFIFRHAAHLTRITCTLDSHLPYQIFHPSWWADVNGRHPDPFTLITTADVESGRWQPLVAPDYSRNYVRQLEARAKKQLTIWPYHVLIGSPGNALDPELWSAVMWHALARKTQPVWVVKGTVPKTEHYSAIQPEIALPNEPKAAKNQAFIDALRASDYVFVAGEAESHCVLETLEDIVEEFQDDPERLERVHVLRDCMSPVQHPEVDFHALALEQFAGFKQKGVKFVNSTDDLAFLQEVDAGRQAKPELEPVVGLG